MRKKPFGLTLLEAMIAMTIMAIITTGCLMLLTQGGRTYTLSKAEQESLKRLRSHISPLLNQIKGARQMQTSLTATGSYSITFVNDTGDKCVKVWWDDVSTKKLWRQDRNYSCSPSPCMPQCNGLGVNTALLTDIDYLRFYPDTDSQLLQIRYRLSKKLPAPIEYTYKLLYTPKLPEPPEE